MKRLNQAYEEWEVLDQNVHSYLFSSLSKEVMTQVIARETVAETWKAIEGMYVVQTCARIMNLRIALANTKKGNLSVADYFAKMESLGNEMAVFRRRLDDEELVEYIITGLGEDFTSLVTALTTMVEPILDAELYSKLLSFKTRMDITCWIGVHLY